MDPEVVKLWYIIGKWCIFGIWTYLDLIPPALTQLDRQVVEYFYATFRIVETDGIFVSSMATLLGRRSLM